MSTAVALPRPRAASSRLRFVTGELALARLQPARPYRRMRNALLVSLGFAAVSYALLPMAPPRLVPDIGIADTVGLASGHDTGSFGGVVPFNPYAAMPSMHVGWSLLVGIFGFRALRGRAVRWVFAAHPVVMAVAVTATGNHYFLDSAAGIAVVACALVAIRLFNPPKER